MARDLSSVRLDEHAHCVYVVFIEGIADAWTNDTSGAVTGSGVGSWIYSSELAIGGREIPGTRRVRTGLVLPEAVAFAIDIKSGQLQPSPLSLEILDTDDRLVALFATEGVPIEILGERVGPGATDLGTSVQTIGGAGTTDPRDRWLGIEKIGPDGERRQWPAIPFDLVGFDHPVHGSLESQRLPPVSISDRPIEHVGRMVTLYRVYMDPSLGHENTSAYYTWDECHAAGDLVWWGTLADSGRVGANRVWSLECRGPESLLQKTLGSRTTMGWTRVAADLTLTDAESYVAIAFASNGVAGPSVIGTYDSSIFDHQITATNRAELTEDLNGWIEDALDGSDTNFVGADGDFDTWVDATGSVFPDAGVMPDGRFFVRRRDNGVNDDATYGQMMICLHERAWRCLGWEPETQHRDAVTFGDVATAYFRRIEAGESLWLTGVDVPGDGYIYAWFSTISPGRPPEDIEAYANNGQPRYWWPLHTSEVFVLDHQGAQVVRLEDEEPNNLYLEGQPTIGTSQAAEIDGTPTDRARFFALRGDVVTAADDVTTEEFETSDAEELYQVVLGTWVEGTHYGTVSEGDGIEPQLYIERLAYPRGYGINHEKLKHDWSGKTVGKGTIAIAPLHAYRYLMPFGEKPWEQADTLFAQILLSTGACAGYDAALDDGGEIVAGPNTHPLAVEFAGDYELADLGLGIPYQLVAHPTDIRSAFVTVPGGWDGDFNRLRLAYVGPFSSESVLESMTRPRLLCWSLHGKQFGLFRLGPVSPEDVDIVITEDDLRGTVGDSTSTMPQQRLRATGQLDGVTFHYRWDPTEEQAAEEIKFRALDAGAPKRTGRLIEEVTDHGVLAHWFGSHQQQITGITDWRPHARQLWERDAPEFFSRRHFAATFTVGQHIGQDSMPGTSVSVTNPWLVDPTGSYGVTGRTGRVISSTQNLRAGSATLECIVFANDPARHYAPIIRVSAVTGTTVEWYEDFLGDGIEGGNGFVEPDWSSAAVDAVANLYQRNGDTWTLVDSAAVVSVDVAARELVIDAPFTGWLRDKDHILVLAPLDDQAAGAWPTLIYGITADDDLTVGDGLTEAPRFV